MPYFAIWWKFSDIRWPQRSTQNSLCWNQRTSQCQWSLSNPWSFRCSTIGEQTHTHKRMNFSIVIIIIMSCLQHGYPRPSLDTSPNHSSLLAGLQGYIPYPHIVCCMYVRAGRPAFAWPYTGVHRSTSLIEFVLASPAVSWRVWFV